jgi:hypothetical protein
MEHEPRVVTDVIADAIGAKPASIKTSVASTCADEASQRRIYICAGDTSYREIEATKPKVPALGS